MDPILSIIDEALKRKGLSDAAASKLAVGHSSLIKNLRMPREGEKRYNMPALQKLAEVLGLEFYFGPPRETGPVEQIIVDGSDYVSIELHDAWLSAGPGAENHGTNIVDRLAFRRDWLKRESVDPSRASLARVTGDSMMPTLTPGDMVLINQAQTEPPIRRRGAADRRRPSIYALVEDGEARIKRIERPDSATMILISDNPEYPPEVRAIAQLERLQTTIIGKVRWWGHSNRE